MNITILSYHNNILSAIILHDMVSYIAPLKDWQDLNERCKTIYRHVAYTIVHSFDTCASTSLNALWSNKID